MILQQLRLSDRHQVVTTGKSALQCNKIESFQCLRLEAIEIPKDAVPGKVPRLSGTFTLVWLRPGLDRTTPDLQQ